MQATCNSHRSSTVSLTELLQIIYMLFPRYSWIFRFNIARLKLDIKELEMLHVPTSVMMTWSHLLSLQDSVRNASTPT